MRALPLAVALCYLLAGCSAPFVHDAGTERGTEADGPPPFDYPPGYGPDGVTNGSLAARTHEATVDSLDRYRLEIDRTLRSENRTDRLAYTWTQGPSAARANYRTYNATSSETVGVWKQGETLRVSRGPGRYSRLPASSYLTVQGDVRAFPVTGFLDSRFSYATGTLARLNASSTEATPVRREGETLLRVTSRTPPAREQVAYHSFEVTLWVDESGQVRRVERRTERTLDGTRVTAVTDARLTEVGTADPSPPVWLDRTANVTAKAEGGLLVVTHHGGPAVEFAGYTPIVGDSDGSRTAPLNGSLAAGDTVYVYKVRDSAELTASRTRPNDSEYRPESGLLYFAAGNETVGVRVGAEV